ncbi:MAG: magnesium-protoporphyrin IX monomethyl ester oxidative cyclase [Geobacteraceae bacterium GWC2_58_44]|nr:MAG: magnesium-protoporphyrin IX monomethyl ester oxidative cyclase [Geobacteraceae bacterium GWC2_58_44]HBG07056.1 magnesium-protoporphyrin IX monomethyl ester oxidative cyclase [Geobacter sp.]
MTGSATPRKITFVTPPYHSGIPELAGRWIPLNFVYLAGAARQAGLRAEIYDAMAKGHGYPEIEERLREAGPDYLATSAITATINDALKTLELAKRINPETVTILGGVHPSFMYREILQSSSAVDYIIIGEGELSLQELLTVLEQGGDPCAVSGLAFRRGEAVVATPKRSLMESLDRLPAAWDLLDWPDYQYFIIPGSRFGAISTSRGCDQECVFCSQQKFWDQSWRARDPQQVADELQYLYSTYQVNVFMITDEYASRNALRWEALLDALIAKDLPIHLIMETRASDIIRDREIVWKYRKAGIIHISVGIESTNQQTLDAIKKGTTVDEAKQALDIIHEHGIVSEASFLVGFPDETVESVKATLKLAQYYNPDNANFFPITPWPYSEMYQELKQYITEWDYSKYNFIESIIEPKQMSRRQLDVAIVDCFRKFYMGKIAEVMMMKDTFKRGYIVRATKLIMGSSFIVKKLSVGTLNKIPAKIEEVAMRFKT